MHTRLSRCNEAQLKLADAFGKKETREYEPEVEDEAIAKKVHDAAYDKCYEVAKRDLLKKNVVQAVKSKKKKPFH